MNDAEVIDVLSDLRIQLTDPEAGLAVLRKLVGAAHQLVFAAVEDVREFRRVDGLANRVRHGLPVKLLKLGLVVERVDVRRPADHEEEDDGLGARREMRRTRGEGIERIEIDGGFASGLRLEPPQRAQRNGSEARTHLVQEPAA